MRMASTGPLARVRQQGRPTSSRRAGGEGTNVRRRNRRKHVCARGLGGAGREFEGAYGRWELEESDVFEVLRYRGGLIAAAAGAVGAVAAGKVAGECSLVEDVALLLMAGGVGAAAFNIRVYIAPAKRFLQALWVAGGIGTLAAVGVAHGDCLLSAVSASSLMLAISAGPVAASLTGVAAKEAVCYGKLSAAALAASTPVFLLMLIFGGGGSSTSATIAGSIAGLALIAFAVSKLMQPITDDVGDKSVFQYLQQQQEEQQR